MEVKDYGWAWINQQQRPICNVRDIKRGKNKGKVEVTLCRGRHSDGSIKPGSKVIVRIESIIELPLKED